jgi:hypothetical protein
MKTISTVILATALALPISPVLSLTSCAPAAAGAGILTPANIAQVRTVVFGLAKVYANALADFPSLIPANVSANGTITAALDGAEAAVLNLSTLASDQSNATALRQATAGAAAALNILAAVLPATEVPPALILGLQAAQVLLPDLNILAGNLSPSVAVPMAPVTIAARAGMMRPGAIRRGATTDAAISASTIPAGTIPAGAMLADKTPTGTMPTGTIPTGTIPTGTTPTGEASLGGPSHGITTTLPARFKNPGMTKDAAMSVLGSTR